MEKSRLMELAGVVTEAKEKVECPFCDKKFVTGSLLKHIKSTHKDDYSDMFEDAEVVTEAEDKEEVNIQKYREEAADVLSQANKLHGNLIQAKSKGVKVPSSLEDALYTISSELDKFVEKTR